MTKGRKSSENDSHSVSLASKLAEVDPDFCEFLKTEDSDLLDDLDNEVAEESDLEEEDDDLDDADEKESDNGESISEGEEGLGGSNGEPDDDDSDDGGILPLSEDEDEELEEDVAKIVKSKLPEKDELKGKELRSLTMTQIREWSDNLDSIISGELALKDSCKVIDRLVAALRCAADKMQPAEKGAKHKDEPQKKDAEDEEEDEDDLGKKRKTTPKKKATASFSKVFSYVGAREFDALIKLCVKRFAPSLMAILLGAGKPEITHQNVTDDKKVFLQKAHRLRTSEKWSRLKLASRVYVETLTDLVRYTSDESVSIQLLDHLNGDDTQILILALPATRRALIQTVVSIWSKGSLLSNTELLKKCHCIIMSAMRNCPAAKVSLLYERIFRRLYRSFMATCKFSPKGSGDDPSFEVISAMRTLLASFVLVAPVPSMAHALAFVRIRHLCSQLRAALSAASVETRARSSKVVLSWPFVRCIDLWADVIATSPEGHPVRQLVYPLTQVTIGTARLQPSPRYYPLRYHCVRILNKIALATSTFIPTLSLILDVFTVTDFNAAANSKSNSSGKDADKKVTRIANLLHFSESQLHDSTSGSGMLDSVVSDLLYFAAAETLNVYAHRVAFPELSLPFLVRLKKFVKACHVPRFVEKMKLLLSKIEENARWIEERRRSAVDLHPANSAAVTAWESDSRLAHPPLAQFFSRLVATMSIVDVSSKKRQFSVDNRKRSSDGIVKSEPSDKQPKRDSKFKDQRRQKRVKKFKKEAA